LDQQAQGITAYLNSINSLQEVILQQAGTLTHIADLMVESVTQDRRIFVFGTGHSHMVAEEGHYRAGGLACVVPILFSSLMVHESAYMATKIERIPGLASTLLERYKPDPREIIFIFSASGVNAVPVEMALMAKERGMTVIGVTNIAYCKVAPTSSLGKRLIEVSDHVIDCGGIPGDSIVPIPGTSWRVGPTSTIMYATIWNCLVTETVFRLQSGGYEIPIYLSNNMLGAAEHNQKLIQMWSGRNPHL
jgi:uncharacterized phosphosugar-binding protein